MCQQQLIRQQFENEVGTHFKMGSPKAGSKKSMPRPFRCSVCGKSYAVDWAKSNHKKHCYEEVDEDDI